MNLKLLILAVIILGIILLIFSIGIFFGKRKKFPESSINKNPELTKRGLTCAKHEELNSCGVTGCCGIEEEEKFEDDLKNKKS